MKKSCVIYDSWGTLIQNLPDEAAGILMKMVLQYAFYGFTNPSVDESINAMFAMIKDKLDEDAEAYEKEIQRRSEAGKKGMARRWNNKTITDDNTVITDDNTVKQNITNITVSDSVSVSVSDKDIKDKRKTFVKPTVEEVKAYCKERNNKVDPYQFVDFYESKGWKVGNQPMKDWKAAVRTWEKRDTAKANPKKVYFKGRDYDFGKLEGELLSNVRQG